MYWHMIPLYYMFDWVRNRPKWALFFEKWHIRFPFFESELLMEVVVCIQGLFLHLRDHQVATLGKLPLHVLPFHRQEPPQTEGFSHGFARRSVE